jgi:hypothetical protein
MHKHQMDEYGQAKIITPHCDTRWCVLHQMAADVLDSKVDSKAMLGSLEWNDIITRSHRACTEDMESEQ